jgi:hypothetical protein
MLANTNLYKQYLKLQVLTDIIQRAAEKIQQRDYSSQAGTISMASFRWVIAGRGRIPFHGLAKRNSAEPRRIPENHITSKVLSIETHRRAATGNTRSQEASRTAGGPRSLGQRPSDLAHTLAWSC